MIDFKTKFKLIESWLNSITGKTLLISHYDADGITSAIIFSRILEKYNKEYKKDFFVKIANDSYRGEFIKSQEIKTEILSYNNIILLDYCFDDYSDFEKLNKNIFVFDHHKSGIINKNFILNPASEVSAEELPSASAIVYDLYYYLFGENKLLKKIGAIGCASDFMIYASLPYLHSDLKDTDLFMNNSQLLKPIIFDTFKKMELIYENKEYATNLFEHLLDTTKTNMLGFYSYNNELIKKIIETETLELTYAKEILNNAKIFEKEEVIIIDLPEDYKMLKKHILNVLELTHSNYIKLVFINSKNRFACSLRGSKINLMHIVNDLKIDSDFAGGGHEFAAGCVGPITKKEILINKVINEINIK